MTPPSRSTSPASPTRSPSAAWSATATSTSPSLCPRRAASRSSTASTRLAEPAIDIGGAPVDVAVGSVDDTAGRDIVVADQASDTVRIFTRDGAGFTEGPSLPVARRPRRADRRPRPRRPQRHLRRRHRRDARVPAARRDRARPDIAGPGIDANQPDQHAEADHVLQPRRAAARGPRRPRRAARPRPTSSSSPTRAATPRSRSAAAARSTSASRRRRSTSAWRPSGWSATRPTRACPTTELRGFGAAPDPAPPARRARPATTDHRARPARRATPATPVRPERPAPRARRHRAGRTARPQRHGGLGRRPGRRRPRRRRQGAVQAGQGAHASALRCRFTVGRASARTVAAKLVRAGRTVARGATPGTLRATRRLPTGGYTLIVTTRDASGAKAERSYRATVS